MLKTKTILSFLLLLTATVQSAGVTVHLTIASLLHQYIPSDIQSGSHLSSYLAGAFFPDAYYNCLGLSDEAEEAHWPPFLQAGVNYYRDEYTSKGLENTELKSFLYGIFTHQVTDLSWHSLHSKQGLLQMLQYLEFDGDNNMAHTFLDPAGDFIVLSKQLRNLSKEKLRLLTEFYHHDWSIPSDDLIEIYHRLGYDTITHGNLDLCVMTGYSALQGEFTSSLITTPKVNYYLNESPMLDEVLLEYYYGGISEIVTTTRICVEQLDSWFDNGIEDPPVDLCSLETRLDSKSTAFDLTSTLEKPELVLTTVRSAGIGEGLYLTSSVANSHFGSSFKVGNFLSGNKPAIAIGAPYDDITGSP
ncbi:unnamed protein product [Ambrosiozyma monospora]|uniref:Unnamed protein product n=1 Tax=Ambrosiozyma monospora TaxID=43982 RepID=A0ACB5U1Y0_AMBMO|nr:unnamed protein product [Ambrosiozyma monospora]